MEAKLINAQLTYNRDRDLLNQGAISQATYDAAYADYLVAKSNYEKASSDVNDTIITTPINGYIIGKPTPVGQTISTDSSSTKPPPTGPSQRAICAPGSSFAVGSGGGTIFGMA